MSLSLIQFEIPTSGDFFYGVLKQGVSQDQVFKALQSDSQNIESASNAVQSLLDMSYTFSGYNDFIALSESDKCGYLYAVDYYRDIVGVQKINGGLGGVSSADRNDSNVFETAYTIADYSFSSELFASTAFMPGEFITGVVLPMFEFAASCSIVLALLSVTFASLGVRMLRRIIGAFGRGR